ncbi:MAG: hypothetical protein DMF97_03415 [Acidobacteria bacterium]|nr:MAG: hypothetical protein DMF97_03415 [Acidobacteriota bacterium]
MNEHAEIRSISLRPGTLQAPEVLEARLTPMFMCCGHWSYALSFGINGPTLTVSWTEDGDAACNQV